MIVLFCNMFPSCGRQTIEVSKKYSVKLIFEAPVGLNKIENGNPLYFQVKKDSKKPIVILTVNPCLKAIEGETHITVISVVSNKGNIYSYTLQVVENCPSKLSLNVRESDAIFNLGNKDKNILIS